MVVIFPTLVLGLVALTGGFVQFLAPGPSAACWAAVLICSFVLICSVGDKRSSALPHICPLWLSPVFSVFTLRVVLPPSVHKWPSSFQAGVHLSGCKLFFLLLQGLLPGEVCSFCFHGGHVWKGKFNIFIKFVRYTKIYILILAIFCVSEISIYRNCWNV